MALSASTVFEVRTTGSDTNGGAFVTGASGTDYSQQNSPQWSFTDAVTNGTTTITTATGGITAAAVGNICYVQGGTGSVTAGWYQITAVPNDGQITLDRSTGLTSGTGVTLKIGGALASLGMVGAVLPATATVWVRSGTYTVTSASTNVSGGCFSGPNGYYLRGYGSTRGDYGTRPIIQTNGSITTFHFILATAGGGTTYIEHLELNGNSQTSSCGLSTFGIPRAYSIVFKNFTNGAINTTYSIDAMGCSATGCTTITAFLAGGGRFVGCVAYSNTVVGSGTNSGRVDYRNCIASGNTEGFSIGATNSNLESCIAYGNSGIGFSLGNTGQSCLNCVSYGNATGFQDGSNRVIPNLFNCAAGGNTTNFGTNEPASRQIGTVTLTADPFVDAAGGNFAPNSTAGGGAALKAVAYPLSFPGISTSNNLDIGAAQAIAAAGGIIKVAMRGGFL